MSKYSSLGIIRNLTKAYTDIRKNQIKDTKKVNLNDSGSIINDNGKMKYNSTNNNQFSLISKSDNKLELVAWHLPPKYVEKFEITLDILKELSLKCLKYIFYYLVTRLQEDQQKRIMPKFNEDENKILDKNIRENVYDMTKKIKECEENIKFIQYFKTENMSEQTSILIFNFK